LIRTPTLQETSMTTPFWCLFVITLMPFVIAPIGGYFKNKQFGSLDNKNPRLQSRMLEGTGARAQAAQENSWEALAVFSVAVIVNHLAGGNPGTASTAAMVFVAARLVYVAAYIADIDKLRSGVFLVGLICVVTLFVSAA
jgi:uncharacterized MAPEG superfamily protein